MSPELTIIMPKTSPEASAPDTSRPVQPEVAASTFYHVLDGQRRITIPREWRAMIGKGELMLVIPDVRKKRLTILLPSLTRAIREKTRGGDDEVFSEEADSADDLFAQCDNISIDDAGRVKINSRLLDFAGITDNVMLKGGGRRIHLYAIDKAQAKEKPVDTEALERALAKWGLRK